MRWWLAIRSRIACWASASHPRRHLGTWQLMPMSSAVWGIPAARDAGRQAYPQNPRRVPKATGAAKASSLNTPALRCGVRSQPSGTYPPTSAGGTPIRRYVPPSPTCNIEALCQSCLRHRLIAGHAPRLSIRPSESMATLAKTTWALPNPAKCRVLKQDRCDVGEKGHAQEPNWGSAPHRGRASTDTS